MSRMNKRIGRRQLKGEIHYLNCQVVSQAKEIRDLMDKVNDLQKWLEKLGSSPDIVPYGLPYVHAEITPQAFGTYQYMPEEYVPEIEDIKEQLVHNLVKNLMENGYVQFIDSLDSYACRRPPIAHTATYAAKLYVVPWHEAVYNKTLAVKALLKEGEWAGIRDESKGGEQDDSN